MLMMRGWLVLLVLACQPLSDNTGELAAHDSRVYFKMALSDLSVKRHRTMLVDPRLPMKIHALRYVEHGPKNNLTLTGTGVNIGLVNLSNVIFSWHHKDNQNKIYTCHMHTVSLGEQRTINIGQHCFEQNTTGEQSGDYVHLLAKHCDNISGNSRYVFLMKGRNFACDLSDSGDKSIVLQASCLAAQSNNDCLNGEVLKMAEDNVGFHNFVNKFKAEVETDMTCNDSEDCTISYVTKEGSVQDTTSADDGE